MAGANHRPLHKRLLRTGSRLAGGEFAAWIALPVLTVVWSLTWTVMKVALDDSGPFTFSAHRYALGTAVAFAWLALRRGKMKPPPWGPTIIIGATQTAAFQALAEWALVRGGAGKTALLAYTMPFWVVPLAWWLLHERPGAKRLACVALAAAGLALVIAPWRGGSEPGSIALALISGLSWAIGTVVSKRTFQRYPRVTPAQLTAWQMLVGTLGLIVLALVIHERRVAWTAGYLFAVAYSGVLSTGIGWVLWAVVVQRLSASVAGLTSLGVPVAGVLFAWALLGERPSGAEVGGIVLIGLALLALNFVRTSQAKNPRPASARAVRAPHH